MISTGQCKIMWREKSQVSDRTANIILSLFKLLWSSPNGDLKSINLYSALDVVNGVIFVVLR